MPQGKETDALTDFSDLFPTFCELAGVPIPDGLDGVSIAPLLMGEADDSPRTWILSMGHGPAKLDEQGVRGVHDYASRVLRDKRYKVWVNEAGQIDQLYDLKADPFEQKNLINSGQEEHSQVLEKFQRIIADFPQKDARPMYDPRPANPWNRTLE